MDLAAQAFPAAAAGKEYEEAPRFEYDICSGFHSGAARQRYERLRHGPLVP